MRAAEFIDVYKKLSPEQKEEMDELIQLQTEKEQQIAELEDKFRTATPQEMQNIEHEQQDYLNRMEEEHHEIDTAQYAIDDPEEAFTLREMDRSNLQDDHREILTTQFPIGIDILEGEIEKIDDQLRKLLPL